MNRTARSGWGIGRIAPGSDLPADGEGLQSHGISMRASRSAGRSTQVDDVDVICLGSRSRASRETTLIRRLMYPRTFSKTAL